MLSQQSGRILLWAIAAALLLVGGVLVGRTRRLTKPDLAARSYEAPPGHSDSIVLQDGTGVVLAPGSRLRVAEGYGVARREVDVVGEARFAVKPDPARPFRVNAGAVVVQDLGASFSVRRDAGGTVAVDVLEGSVLLTHAVGRPGQGVSVNAGERGVLSPDGRAWVERRP